MNKYCKQCQTTKPVEAFYTNGWQKSGIRKYKPTCKPCERQTARQRLNKLIHEFYGGWICKRCGFQGKPVQFDCHHRDPAEKEFPISQVAQRALNSPTRLIAELKKCDLLCACCHRLEHELGQ